jgi:hypothetical protein
MAASLVVSTAKASTDSGFSVTTDPIDTSGANLIYIAISRWTAGTLNSFTDSKGNTWILSEGAATLSGAGLIGYYCIDPAVGSGHTFTATSLVSSNTYPTVGVLAFSGASGGVLDEDDVEVNSGTAATTDPVTPISDGSVVISAMSVISSISGLAVSGGALAQEVFVNYVASQSMGLAMAYEIQTTAATRSAAWSWTGTTGAAAVISSFAEGASPIRATSIFGEGCTVEGISRVHAINLDGVTRTHSNATLAGSVVLGGNLTLIEQGAAPAGVSNTARIFAIDDGAGKTRLMVQFGTGTAIEIAVEA